MNKQFPILSGNTVPAENDRFWFSDTSNDNQYLDATPAELRKQLGWTVNLQAFDEGTAVSTGDGAVSFAVPATYNGLILKEVMVAVAEKGVTGTTDVVIRKSTGGVDADMLSTEVTVGDEFFAADGVIDTGEDDIATGDIISVDVDAVHSGTAPNGLFVTLVFKAA